MAKTNSNSQLLMVLGVILVIIAIVVIFTRPSVPSSGANQSTTIKQAQSTYSKALPAWEASQDLGLSFTNQTNTSLILTTGTPFLVSNYHTANSDNMITAIYEEPNRAKAVLTYENFSSRFFTYSSNESYMNYNYLVSVVRPSLHSNITGWSVLELVNNDVVLISLHSNSTGIDNTSINTLAQLQIYYMLNNKTMAQ